MIFAYITSQIYVCLLHEEHVQDQLKVRALYADRTPGVSNSSSGCSHLQPVARAAKHSWAYHSPRERKCGIPGAGSQHRALQTCLSSLRFSGIEVAFLCLSTNIHFGQVPAMQSPHSCLAR